MAGHHRQASKVLKSKVDCHLVHARPKHPHHRQFGLSTFSPSDFQTPPLSIHATTLASARPRWLSAFFTSDPSSAKLLSWPSGAKSGS